MKKNLMLLTSLLLLLLGAATVEAQIRVGGYTEPDSNAVLDLNANDTDNGSKGLLLPRVALVATAKASPLTAHVAGMYVYNTVTANDVSPGVYYNDGTKWIRSGSEAKPGVKQFQITIGADIDTQSMIFHGETASVSSELKVLSIEPVFSDDVMSQTLLTVNSLAKPNETGTAVRWSVRIANANINSKKTCKLEKIIISYICDDDLRPSRSMGTYILVGQ